MDTAHKTNQAESYPSLLNLIVSYNVIK